jgi:hypothetical protein
MTKIDVGAWLTFARQRLSLTSSNPSLEAQALLSGQLKRKPFYSQIWSSV